MSQLRKIVIGLIITLIMILGINNTSNATLADNNYKVGDIVEVNLPLYRSDSSIFCMEKNQRMWTVGKKYKVISKVEIVGNKSTDHTGKTITSWHNAKLAAILNGNNGSVKSAGPVAKSIWNYGTDWIKNVGKQHAGLYDGFAKKEHYNTQLEKDANKYANSYNANKNIQDKTVKANIKVTNHEKDGKQYLKVGPFNWVFQGNLTNIDAYNQEDKAIGEKLFSIYNGTQEQFINVNQIKSGKDFYISVPMSTDITQIKRLHGETQINVKAATVWFMEASQANWQNLLIRKPYETTEKISTDIDLNLNLLANLKVIKVNADNTKITLPNVCFYIQNKETGKYVVGNNKTNGEFTAWSDTREGATEFVTDNNGEITIKNLITGTYVAYEVRNPNYGYQIDQNGKEYQLSANNTVEVKIENKQIYVKLSGFVWVDEQTSKQSYRNDLYKVNQHPTINGYSDDQDILLDGITVRLKDRLTGQTVKEVKTSELGRYKNESGHNGHGEYLFEDVLIAKLKDYYIEFEYDGLTYTNVIPHIDNENNGSKAQEDPNERARFNQNFSIVEGGQTNNTGITRNPQGNQVHNLSYTLDELNHKATLDNTGKYPITANTEVTGYNIEGHFTPGAEEIKHINLGLYEREQPDIALSKDLENVRVSVNGYNHTYFYAQRNLNQGDYEGGFNVGVRFANEYGSIPYTRAIYRADYEYENKNDASKELEVYATYKLVIRNESTNLLAKVNSIADYYDSNYTLLKAGTRIDTSTGEISDDVKYDNGTQQGEYIKTIIHVPDDNSAKIGAQRQKEIYVQFKLNREAVIKILNDGENLENVAEITSYSVFDSTGNIYAGIDVDSNPGNITVPNDKRTYQDDTESAPGLKLEVSDARQMTGKVFLDETSGELMTGQVRQGSGAYEEGETGIRGVQITLTETTGSGKVYQAETDTNGDFLIENYIPGDYTLTYTWGDKTYTVQNYKGTIYDSTRDQNNKNWYKENVDKRSSDAIDDYALRQQIDDEMKSLTNTSKTTIDKMNSTTPTMGIGVEYETVYTASSGDRYVYLIKNIDFGIVERARQDLALVKRVGSFKLTLANGEVMANVTIDENGNMTGERNHLSYMKPSETSVPKNGFVRMELDNELIQGATVEVGYVITAKNNSELDYLSENFYKYGIREGNVVTITPSGIVDYLDHDWAFETQKNPDWEIKNVEQLKELVAENVYNTENSDTTIQDKTIIYTESLKNQKLEPTQQADVTINVAKTLSTAEEILLDNEAEVVKLEKTGGSKPNAIPGNYVPGAGHTESDDNMAESVIVTPSTGENLAFIVPITIGVIALVVLATGIVLIKKKTLGKTEE